MSEIDADNPFAAPLDNRAAADAARVAEVDPAALAKKGRVRLLGALVGAALISAVTVSVMASVSPEKTPVRLIRLMLTVGLFFCVYRGMAWARVVTVVLSAIGAIAGAVGLVALRERAGGDAFYLLAVMTFSYTTVVLTLTASPSVREFLKQQRSRPATGVDTTSER